MGADRLPLVRGACPDTYTWRRRLSSLSARRLRWRDEGCHSYRPALAGGRGALIHAATVTVTGDVRHSPE
jgi:hypothetical protein